MARKKKAPNAEVADTGVRQAIAPGTEATDIANEPQGSATLAAEPTELAQPRRATIETASSVSASQTATAPEYAADPRPVMTVNLGGYSGGPAIHLLRSNRFKQMQVRFEQGQPDEQYLTMLKRSEWLDRTESEEVWTKQIDPNARLQSVDRMEQEFKAIANAIRKDRGLEPVLDGSPWPNPLSVTSTLLGAFAAV